jgi:hypothetical protein
MNTVDALLSRAEISETIFRYARGFDRMDLDMALSCFHADSVHDHGAWRIAHRRGIYEWSKIGPAADNGRYCCKSRKSNDA